MKRAECFCCSRQIAVTARGRLYRHVFGDAMCPGSGQYASEWSRRMIGMLAILAREALSRPPLLWRLNNETVTGFQWRA